MFSFSPAMVRLADPTRKACGAPVSSQAAQTLRWASERPWLERPVRYQLRTVTSAALHEVERGAAVGVGG